jgi:hypothetical protein
MNARDLVTYNGRKAIVIAIREDGTIALLMQDTGRMLRIKAAKASQVTVR